MKQIVILISLLGAAITARGQWWPPGTVDFTNYAPQYGVDARATDASGHLLGSDYRAQLYAGATPDSLTPVGAAVAFKNSVLIAGTGTGKFYGYEVDIAFLPPEHGGWFQVKAWAAANGSSYEAALAANGTLGVSNIFHLDFLGNMGVTPTTPVSLVGLQPWTVQPVPEPATLALGLLGALGLALKPRH